jgi:hypothetical protein
MGRSAGVRPYCSWNNGKKRRGEQPDVQAESLTQRLVSEFWACHSGSTEESRQSSQPTHTECRSGSRIVEPRLLAWVLFFALENRARKGTDEHGNRDKRALPPE